MENLRKEDLKKFITDYFSLINLLFNDPDNRTVKKNSSERKIKLENFYKDFLDFIENNLEEKYAQDYLKKLELFKNRTNTWLSTFREPALRMLLMSSNESYENPKFNMLWQTVDDTSYFFEEELNRLFQNKVKFKPNNSEFLDGGKLLLKKAFIVHGHDVAAQQETARFLEQIGFEAIILSEQPNKGMTIIEKLEHYIDTNGFGVVLYTPDDEGSAKEAVNYKPRARQNVVFEHGWLIGAVGRNRVVQVVTDHNIELPNDISGVVYLSEKSWKLDFLHEIAAMGYEVDFNLLRK